MQPSLLFIFTKWQPKYSYALVVCPYRKSYSKP
jgi:hypothetical protein